MTLNWAFMVERVTGIEPASRAWEALILPLNYTRSTANPSTGKTPAGQGGVAVGHSGEGGMLWLWRIHTLHPHPGRGQPAHHAD